MRGVVATGYKITVKNVATAAVVWSSPMVVSNRTTYIPYSGATPLSSDQAYTWEVQSYYTAAADSGDSSSPVRQVYANSTFSTALMEQADWAGAQWISLPDSDLNTQFASQMRKVFTIPKGSGGAVTHARVFLALPGYGQLSINGRRVDDPSTGTRSVPRSKPTLSNR